MEVIEWLEQSWVIIAAAIAIITAVWNFSKTLKEIKANLMAPITEINAKMDILAADNQLLKDASLASQRKELLDSCEECLKNGFATIERQQTINEMYTTYHALGGDTFITDLVHRVSALPVEKPRKTKTTK